MADIGKAQIEISIKDLTREQLAGIKTRIDEVTKARNIEIGKLTPKEGRVGLGGLASEAELLQTGEKLLKAEGAARVLAGVANGANKGLDSYQKAIEDGADKMTAIAAGIQDTAKTAIGAVPIAGQVATAFYELGQSIAVAVGLQEDYKKQVEDLTAAQNAANAAAKKRSDSRQSVEKSIANFASELEKTARDSGLNEVDRQIAALMDKRDAQLKSIEDSLLAGGLSAEARLEKINEVEEATNRERVRIIQDAGKKAEKAFAEQVAASQKALAGIAATIGELDFGGEEKNADVAKFEQRLKTLAKLREDARAAQASGGSLADLEAIERDIDGKAKQASEALLRGLQAGVEAGLKSTADRIAELDRSTASTNLAGMNLPPVEAAQARAAQEKDALRARFAAENEAVKADFAKRLADAQELDRRTGVLGTAAKDVQAEFDRLTAAMQRNQDAQLQAADIQVKTAQDEAAAKEQAARDDLANKLQEAEQQRMGQKERIEAQIRSMASGVSGFSTLGVTQSAFKKSVELQEQLAELRRQTEELGKINANIASLQKTGITVQ